MEHKVKVLSPEELMEPLLAVMEEAEALFIASIIIKSSMRLSLTGEQVDCTMKQSEPRTDSCRDTAISPSEKVAQSLLPSGMPKQSAMP